MKTTDKRLIALDEALVKTLGDLALGARPFPVQTPGTIFTIIFTMRPELDQLHNFVPAFLWNSQQHDHAIAEAKKMFQHIGGQAQVLGFLHLGLEDDGDGTAVLETRVGNQAWRLAKGHWEAD